MNIGFLLRRKGLHRTLQLALQVVLAVAVTATAEASLIDDCLGPAPRAGLVVGHDENGLSLADGTVLKLAAVAPIFESRYRIPPGQTVFFRPVSQRRDRRGRLHAFVSAGGRLLQQEHITRGATAVLPLLPFRDPEIDDTCWMGLFASEKMARESGAGIWAGEQRVFHAGDPALAERVGLFTIVEGRVLSVGDRRRNSYLNFGRFWSKDFTVVVPDRVRDRWGVELLAPKFDRRRIRVRGYLESRGGPMIVIEDPAQIELLPPPETSG